MDCRLFRATFAITSGSLIVPSFGLTFPGALAELGDYFSVHFTKMISRESGAEFIRSFE